MHAGAGDGRFGVRGSRKPERVIGSRPPIAYKRPTHGVDSRPGKGYNLTGLTDPTGSGCRRSKNSVVASSNRAMGHCESPAAVKRVSGRAGQYLASRQETRCETLVLAPSFLQGSSTGLIGAQGKDSVVQPPHRFVTNLKLGGSAFGQVSVEMFRQVAARLIH